MCEEPVHGHGHGHGHCHGHTTKTPFLVKTVQIVILQLAVLDFFELQDTTQIKQNLCCGIYPFFQRSLLKN